MINYNTSLSKLKMREYGRHIQKLIDHCVSLENKDERTQCAKSISAIMMQMFPELKTEGEENRTVWDHINIISDFKLDIDFPCEVIKETEIRPIPTKIPYSRKSERFRVYGSNIVGMLKTVSKMEGGLEKDNLIFLIANQMKKLLISVNSEIASDQRVFNDIREISGGFIDIKPDSYRLNEYIGIPNNQENKKKKKK